MENTIFTSVKAGAAALGLLLGAFFGELSGLFFALLGFVVADFMTGLACAVVEKNLSSDVGLKGIFKKVMIFMLVGVANLLDVHVLGGHELLKSAVMLFYLANEGISLLENASRLGLPVPAKLKDALAQLKESNKE